MENISGYQLKEKIHEGNESRVFRATRKSDGLAVVLKTTSTEFPTPRDMNRFKHEFSIGHSIPGRKTVKYLALEYKENFAYIVTEDFGAVSLRNLMDKRQIDLRLFFEFARNITASLGEIHEYGIIHKNLTPNNILINPVSHEIKINDFSIGTPLLREKQEGGGVNTIEGTLEYISPEQTGRMNRTVDYRSDFYSLGIIFYEMLSGERPFISEDKLSLIHSHLATTPKPLYEMNPAIPKMVSDIVMKLLSKTAEQRYKSAFGLLSDLKECEDEYLKTNEVNIFEAGKNDISSEFNIPEKLYGRDTELKLLLETFDRVCKGSREILMVSGYSGIGKSALVHEILKPVVAKKGYFVSGKFDQFQRNLPYSAMISSYRLLIQQLLTEGEKSLTAWKEKFLEAFGPNGQLMIDVIPELELIIGKQPPPVALSGEAARNRFTLIFRNFIKSLTSIEHPIVLFLDDLQWADLATINLIHDMMKVAVHNESKYLFLLGAYRDNEVNAAHPLMIMLNQIKEFGTIIDNIVLSPLNYNDISELVTDTLEGSTEMVESLVKIIYEKTAGNPFFINQFLRELHNEKLLTFNSDRGQWVWDAEKIKQKSYTDNVIDLMSSKIMRLKSPTKNAIKFASIAGIRFEVGMLSNLFEKTVEEIRRDMSEAVSEGLVVPVSDSVGLISMYQFIHDRVQQAANSLLNESELLQTHYKIGMLIAENSNGKTEERLFDIVNHLNFSNSLIGNQEEKTRLANFNLRAAAKAKASNAYAAALEYLNVGISLLPTDCWESEYTLSLALYSAGVEVSYLNKDFEQMEKMIELVETNSKELIDKISSLEIKVQALAAQSRLLEAIQEAREVLALLDVNLPNNPGKLDIMMGLMATKWAIGRKKTHELIHLPEMKDPLKLAAMRILISTTSSAFLAMPNMFPVIVFNLVRLSLKFGNSKYSTYGYATYGLVLCGALGEMKNGNRFGHLALDLMNQYDATELKAKVFFVYNAFIYQWQHALRETRPYFLEGYNSGLETGDFEYGGWNAFHYASYSFYAGELLNETSQSLIDMKEQGEKLGIKQVTLLMDIWIQTMKTIIGDVAPEENMLSPEFKDELMSELKKLKYTTGIFERFLALGMCNYYFNNFEEARKNLHEAGPMVESVMGMEYTVQFYFFAALTLTKTSGVRPAEVNKKLKNYIKKLKKWAGDSPDNYLHKYELIMAEFYRMKGERMKAADFYEHAIEHASKNKYLNDEAIANESAAEFYLAQDKKDIALTYIVKARYAYLQWGAKAKVELIDEQYEQLLKRAVSTAADFRSKYSKTDSLSFNNHKNRDSESLDMITVLKASQTLSSEIVLDNFLKKLMLLITQNAGAEKGYLILEKDGKFYIEAESVQNSDEVKTRQALPVDGCRILAESIIKYVTNTKESVILDDASDSPIFGKDDFIIAHNPKSILCAPFLNHGKIKGIIYLSNDLMVGAFTEKRLALLRLLTGQIAISIENALFYDQLENRVKDRTKELQVEKKKSDDLLLNILPVDVAEELKHSGHSKARNYEQVSVMFTDFVNFTQHSEKLSPEELVAEIDMCFRKFDDIITKHKMEKIKTIGDAYLCVAGIPETNEESVRNTIRAATEIRNFLSKMNRQREKENQSYFEIRIGIHTGPLVAGIVGVKKFAYDIWGDTVNIAARMEQSCLAGKINISEATYKLLEKNVTMKGKKKEFKFEYRGEIDAKNKGKMKMYFVN